MFIDGGHLHKMLRMQSIDAHARFLINENIKALCRNINHGEVIFARPLRDENVEGHPPKCKIHKNSFNSYRCDRADKISQIAIGHLSRIFIAENIQYHYVPRSQRPSIEISDVRSAIAIARGRSRLIKKKSLSSQSVVNMLSHEMTRSSSRLQTPQFRARPSNVPRGFQQIFFHSRGFKREASRPTTRNSGAITSRERERDRELEMADNKSREYT